MPSDVSIRLGATGEKEFRDALKGAESQIKALQSEMKSVVSSFSGVEDAEERTIAQTQILGRTMEANRQKISVLTEQLNRQKETLEQLGKAQDEAIESGDPVSITRATNAYNKQATEVNRLTKQLNDATADMNRMEKEMRDIESGADRAGNALDDLGSEAKSAGSDLKSAFAAGAVGGAVSALVSNIGGLIDSTMEMQVGLSRIEQNAKNAGVGMDVATEAFSRFNAISGQTDSSVEALSNLLSAGLKEGNLIQAVEALSGAVTKFPDTLNIESLADSLQETLATGAATGQFGELLDRLGIGAENFSAGLSACTSEAEKQNYALETLANAGLNDIYNEYVKGNQGITGYRNATAKLQMALASIADTIMPVVVPAISALASGLSALQPVIEFLISNFPAIAAGIGAVAAAVGLINLPSVIAMLGTLVASITGVGTTIAGVVAAIGGPVTIVVAAIAGITAVIVTLWNTNEGFRQAVMGIWQNIQQIFQGAWQFIQSVWSAALPFFQAIWNGIQAVFSVAASVLGGFFSAAWSAVSAVWGAAVSFFQGVWNGIETIFSVVEAVLTGDFQAARTGIESIWSGVASFFSGIWNQIKGVFADAGSYFLSIGKNIVNGIKNGIANAWNQLVSWLKSKLSGLVDAAMGALGIASPSREFAAKVGVQIPAGIGEGIKSGMSNLLKTVTNMTDSVVKAGSAKVGVQVSSESGIGNIDYEKVVESLSEQDPILTDYLTVLLDRLNSLIRDFFSRFKDSGVYLMKGVAQGVREGRSQVINAIEDALWAAVEAAREEMDINSPSGLTASLVGVPMGQGVAKGFVDSLTRSRKAVERAMTAPVERVSKNDLYNSAAGMVNGMAAVGASTGATQPIIIQVNLSNKQIAEVLYDPLKQVGKQRGY